MVKRTLLRLAALLAAVAATMALILVALPYRGVNYYHTFAIKHTILDTTSMPRMILVGGSNVNFGYNSEVIADETGYHPVNMGIHAGLGLLYMLEEVRSTTREGDIVIVSSEYHQFIGGQYLGGMALGLLLLTDYDAFGYITNVRQLKHLARAIPPHTQDIFYSWLRIPNPPKPGFLVGDLNRYGDVGIDVENEMTPTLRRDKLDWGLNPAVVPVLNRFYEDQRAKGVHVYLTYPAVPPIFFQQNLDIIPPMHAQLMEQLEMPVISEPEEAVYPDEMFYDTIYHLRSTRARAVNTRRMLADLAKYEPGLLQLAQ